MTQRPRVPKISFSLTNQSRNHINIIREHH